MLLQFVTKYRTEDDLQEVAALKEQLPAAVAKADEALQNMQKDPRDKKLIAAYRSTYREVMRLRQEIENVYRRAEARYYEHFSAQYEDPEERRAAILDDLQKKLDALDEKDLAEFNRHLDSAQQTRRTLKADPDDPDGVLVVNEFASQPRYWYVIDYCRFLTVFQVEALRVHSLYDEKTARTIAERVADLARRWELDVPEVLTLEEVYIGRLRGPFFYPYGGRDGLQNTVEGVESWAHEDAQEDIEGKHETALEETITAPLFKPDKDYLYIGVPSGYSIFDSLLSIGADAPGETGTRKKVRSIVRNGHVYREIISIRKGPEETLLLDMINAYISENNFYRKEDSDLLNRTARLSFKEALDALKIPDTQESRKKFSRDLRKIHLPAINGSSIELRDNDGTFITLQIGAGLFAVNPRKDVILIELRPEYAAAINSAPLRPYFFRQLLPLYDRRNPVHYSMGKLLLYRYFNDKARAKKTHNILGVSTILNDLQDFFPTFEEVQAKSRGHWPERIRAPFEKALDRLREVGLFEWEYCKERLAPCTEEERKTRVFDEWNKLYITFRFLPKEPEDTGRLERKQARIEAKQKQEEAQKDTKKGTVKTAKGYSKNRKRVQ